MTKGHIFSFSNFFSKSANTQPINDLNKEFVSKKPAMTKTTKWWLFINLYTFTTLMFCPYFANMLNDFIDNEYYFFYYIVGGLSLINVFVFSRFLEVKEYKIDLSLRYITLLLTQISIFFNIFLVKVQKFFFYVYNYKLNKVLSLFIVFIK